MTLSVAAGSGLSVGLIGRRELLGRAFDGRGRDTGRVGDRLVVRLSRRLGLGALDDQVLVGGNEGERRRSEGHRSAAVRRCSVV
jgi:hypothetical protein